MNLVCRNCHKPMQCHENGVAVISYDGEPAISIRFGDLYACNPGTMKSIEFCSNVVLNLSDAMGPDDPKFAGEVQRAARQPHTIHIENAKD